MRDTETNARQVTDNIVWSAIDKKMTAVFSSVLTDSNRYNSTDGQLKRTLVAMISLGVRTIRL